MMPSSTPLGSTPLSAGPVAPVNAFLRFLNELDVALVPFANSQRLDLYHLGRSALVSQYQATFSTKDIDVVELHATPQQQALQQKAHELFGKNTPKAKELGLYLDLVPQPMPPVSNGFLRRSNQVQGDWQVIRLWELAPNDLAATKMKRFHAQDRQDLRFLCDLGLLQADTLRTSMEEAWLWDPPDCDARDKAFANLKLVIDYLEGRSARL